MFYSMSQAIQYIWVFGRAESCRDVDDAVVNWQPHKYTPQTHDTAAILVDLQVLYGRRCEEESAPWIVRWAAPAPSLYMVYFLIVHWVASLLDALSYIQYNRTAINPTFMRLIIFSFCWHSVIVVLIQFCGQVRGGCRAMWWTICFWEGL